MQQGKQTNQIGSIKELHAPIFTCPALNNFDPQLGNLFLKLLILPLLITISSLLTIIKQLQLQTLEN